MQKRLEELHKKRQKFYDKYKDVSQYEELELRDLELNAQLRNDKIEKANRRRVEISKMSKIVDKKLKCYTNS